MGSNRAKARRVLFKGLGGDGVLGQKPDSSGDRDRPSLHSDGSPLHVVGFRASGGREDDYLLPYRPTVELE